MANALRFPSNGEAPASSFIAFQFTGANLLAIYPATYIWRIKPRQHTGYKTTMFWGNNGTFLWDSGSPNTYYGAHPYPQGGSGGTVHNWEISVDGGDVIDDDNANDTTVINDVWYTQALVVRNTGSGKEHKFYWDLATSTTRVITWTAGAGYGNTNPPSPALTFGDAPWGTPNERMAASIYGIKITKTNLSLADIQSEIADPTQWVTSAGSTNKHWLKHTFATVDDLTDADTGISAAWAASDKATLESLGGVRGMTMMMGVG